MIDTSTLTKRYYTIAEVSKLFGVANSLLRYWEGEFKQINPRKDRGGTRRYTAKDIERIDQIYELLKNRGFTIEGARKELLKGIKTKMTHKELKERLETTLGRLKKLKEEIGD